MEFLRQFSEAGKNINGQLLVQLRAGHQLPLRPTNNYLYEAVALRDMLFTAPELESQFSSLFADMSKPLMIDVGCYFGDTIKELAQYNHHINVLGLDIKYKRVVKSCRKITKAKITNAKIALCDIQQLLPILPEQSLYGMCVFFPDPWEKSRHERNRYLNEAFFKRMSVCLRKDGFIWFKTDHSRYFQDTLETAFNANFKKQDDLPGGVLASRNYRTLFEEIFREQGHPIYQAIFLMG